MGLFIGAFILFLLVCWKMIADVRLANEYAEKLKQHEYLKKYKTRQLLENLDPRRFEYVVAEAFKRHGYEAEVTKATNDGGKDIILTKGKEVEFVEVKRYCETTIGRPHIQKLHSAIIDAGAKGGYFVTLSKFNRNARTYAARNGIVCIDGERLIQMIQK